MVFTALPNMKAGQAFCADLKGRMKAAGRNPAHMMVMPACFVMLGDTRQDAERKRSLLDSKVNYANAIASLSIALGHDASKFDPDKPLPDDIPESNASQSGRARAIDLGKRENLTVRQLAQRLGGFGGLAMVGTAKSVADEMEEWLASEASDGFTIQFPYLPGSLDEFCDQLVPELQRRGLYRREYRGKTLRENLGLPRPENRFFRRDSRRSADAAE
jgi:alkanesulfonate monooxygenase